MNLGRIVHPGGRLARLSGRDRRWIALLLLAFTFVVYNANLRQVSSFDTLASRYVPLSLLREGNLDLDEYFPSEPDSKLPSYLSRKDGRLYDAHPVVGPLLALPVYVPFAYTTRVSDSVAAAIASKLAASAEAALAVAIFYLLMCELAGARTLRDRGAPGALVAALTLGLGTGLWATGSQGLYTHAPAALGLVVALYSMVRGRPLMAGLAAGCAASARPALAVIVAILAGLAWCLGEDRTRSALRYAVGVGVIGTLTALYRYEMFGGLLHSEVTRNEVWFELYGTTSMFGGNLLEGFTGLLVNPSRGLLVHSPVLVFALIGAWKLARPRQAESDAASTAILVGRYAAVSSLVSLLIYGKYIVWWGAHGYGAKYLTDVLPLIVLLVPFGIGWAGWRLEAVSSQRFRRRAVAAAFLLFLSIAVQVIGATCYPSSWLLSKEPPYYERLWDWRFNQIATCLREGPRLDPTARRLFERLGIVD